MIWLTWRQFRAQALVGFGVVALIAIYTLILGLRIHSAYNGDLSQCHDQPSTCGGLLSSLPGSYDSQLGYLNDLLIAIPGVTGLFWGAPLIARELEAGTHRLVWNQSVTRGRWLAVKLGVIGLFCMAAAGLLSLLLTWAASPIDTIEANRFSPLLFDARNITPLAYAAFAFALGSTLGLFIRRTVPAMAVTLVIFAVVQVAVPHLARPHFNTPTTTTMALTSQRINSLSFIGRYGAVGGIAIPGAWVVSTTGMLDSSGQEIGHTAMYASCTTSPSLSATASCLGKQNLHIEVESQPASRYWPFQWIEAAIFAALAALLSGLCFWRIRGRLA